MLNQNIVTVTTGFISDTNMFHTFINHIYILQGS